MLSRKTQQSGKFYWSVGLMCVILIKKTQGFIWKTRLEIDSFLRLMKGIESGGWRPCKACSTLLVHDMISEAVCGIRVSSELRYKSDEREVARCCSINALSRLKSCPERTLVQG